MSMNIFQLKYNKYSDKMSMFCFVCLEEYILDLQKTELLFQIMLLYKWSHIKINKHKQ